VPELQHDPRGRLLSHACGRHALDPGELTVGYTLRLAAAEILLLESKTHSTVRNPGRNSRPIADCEAEAGVAGELPAPKLRTANLARP
jgi:hypothetical protein